MFVTQKFVKTTIVLTAKKILKKNISQATKICLPTLRTVAVSTKVKAEVKFKLSLKNVLWSLKNNEYILT